MIKSNLLLLLALLALAHSLSLDVPLSHQMTALPAHEAKVESPCKSGQVIVSKNLQPTKNGCGSAPWHVKLGKMMSPYLKHLTECCNAHDACFDTCTVSDFKKAFTKCNVDFKECMY